MNRPKHIVCVHQGHDLYGSDRVFRQSLHLLRALFPTAELRIHLPQEGRLAEMLRRDGFTPRIGQVFALRFHDLRRDGVPVFLARWVRGILPAWRQMRGADAVYLNSSVLGAHLLAAPFVRGRVIVHIHEIPRGWTRLALNGLVVWSGAGVVAVSWAVRRAFALPFWQKSAVVPNTLSDFPSLSPLPPFDGTLRLLLPGRFSRHKGQDLALEALSALDETERKRIHLRLVGDAYQADPTLRQSLEKQCAARELSDKVSFWDFTDDMTSHYQWAHVVAMPTRSAEPFGLVALEAMAQGRAVIAANHGGVTEFVRHGTDGLLFTPNDAAAFAACLRAYLQAPAQLAQHGQAGRLHAEEYRDSGADSPLSTALRALWHGE